MPFSSVCFTGWYLDKHSKKQEETREDALKDDMYLHFQRTCLIARYLDNPETTVLPVPTVL